MNDDTTPHHGGADRTGRGEAPQDEAFEQLLRFRLHQLADHAPTTVRSIDEIRVEHDNRPSAAARRRGRHRRTAGIGATVAALVGAAGFTTIALTGAGTAGAASPEDAAAQFLDAAGDEDVFGMVDTLDPSEVEVLRGGLQEVRAEAVGADVVTESFSLDGLAGLDVTFADLAFSTEPLVEGVTVVEVTGAAGWSLDPTAFPAGSEIRELLGDGGSGSFDLAALEVPSVLVAVERDGRWFVSGSYTLLEWIRRGRDLAAPTTVLPAVGATSPEQAATGFLGGLVQGDVEAAFSVTPPGEGDAVRTYAPILAAELTDARVENREAGLDLVLSDVGYTIEGDGARRWLTPTSFTISGTVPEPPRFDVYDPSLATLISSYDGFEYYVIPAGEPIPPTVDGLVPVGVDELPSELTNYTIVDEDGRVDQLEPLPPSDGPDAIEIVRADGCTTMSGPGIEGALGLPVEMVDADELMFGGSGVAGFEQLAPDVWQTCRSQSFFPFGAIGLLAGGTALDLPALEVVEVDGAWYVSPAGSVVGTVIDAFAQIGTAGSLLDSDLGLYLIGTNRETLEIMLVGSYVPELTPECQALVVGSDIVTALRDDITVARARACSAGSVYVSDGVMVDGEGVIIDESVASEGFEFEAVPASTAPEPGG